MRSYFSAIIGNLLKYYDQSIYAWLVPFLAPLFFPHEDPVYSLLAGYALLPLGLIAKPLGAYVFGKLGDRLGTSISLSITLLGLGATTISIGCLPTFKEAGWIAPALLSFGKLLQQFFAAGEGTGGALFLLEQTKPSKRGFMSSLFDASGILGAFFAALAVTLLGEASWRYLFWLGGFSAMAGLILRKTPDKKNKTAQKKALKWARSDWAVMLSIGAVSGFCYANYYLLSTFLNGFLPMVSRVTLQEALKLNSWLHAVDFFLLPCFGYLSLKISKEKLVLAALFLGAVLSFPLFFVLKGADAWIAGGVRMVFMTIGVCLSAPYHAWAMENAPEEKRFSICAMGSALGSKLIGAPAPVLGLWLYTQTGWIISPAIALVFSACLGIAGTIYLKKRKLLSLEKWEI